MSREIYHPCTFFVQDIEDRKSFREFQNGWSRVILIGNAFCSFRTIGNGISRREADALWPSLEVLVVSGLHLAFLYLRAIRFEAVKIFCTRERFRLNVYIKKKKKKLKRTEGRLNDTRHYKNCIHKILDYSIQIVYERWNICNRPINF